MGDWIRDIIIWGIIGIAAGWLAGVITRTERNIWGDLVLGLVGALIAGFILRTAIGPGNIIGSIIAAAVVAVILVLIKNMVMGSRT